MRPSRGGHATEGTIIAEHDCGRGAYKVNAVFSETFLTHDEALAAAQAAAKEQEVPGHTETIEYEDDKGKFETSGTISFGLFEVNVTPRHSEGTDRAPVRNLRESRAPKP